MVMEMAMAIDHDTQCKRDGMRNNGTDLEWKVLYVGSAKDSSHDQVLDEVLVGPVPVGTNKFVLQADAPDPSRLATDDLLGVTVVLVTCSYKEREFVRVGYYVNNEYNDPNALPPPPTMGDNGEAVPAAATPSLPNPIPIEHIQRQILADKPRVTKFPISWGEQDEAAATAAMPTQTNDNVAPMQEDSNMSFAMGGGIGATAE